jgi:hypothetical protein
MACSHHNSSATIVASQLLPGQGEFEPTAVTAREDQNKIKPRIMRDSVHVDPEHVWGDEGPVNEKRPTSGLRRFRS